MTAIGVLIGAACVLAVGAFAPVVARAQGGSGLSNPGQGAASPNPAPTPAPAPAPTPAPAVGELPPSAPMEAPVGAESGEGVPEVDPGAVPGTERMRLLVIDAATFGIDPVVGRVASAQMRATAEEMGYEVLTQEQTIAAAQQLQMPYPPTPADLWRVSWIARVHRGVFARIWAHAGQYVVEITVASLDGGGPFFARGASGADNLREVVAQLVRTACPAPNVWNAQSPETPDAGSEEAIEELDEDEVAGESRPAAPAEPEPELRRWSLTLQTEAVIGASSEFFYNHLIGARLDFRITPTIALGAYVAYANLNGRDDRAHNILFMLQFENRIRISSDLDLTIPLRGAVGYLPFNGPLIRLAAGLNYAFTPDFEMGLDIIAPTFWFLPDRTAVSLDIGLEGTLRF